MNNGQTSNMQRTLIKQGDFVAYANGIGPAASYEVWDAKTGTRYPCNSAAHAHTTALVKDGLRKAGN